MCKCTSWMRHPNSGLPEFGNIIVQVGNSRLGCAGPESILPIVVMDSGLARFTRALSDKRYALARGMTATTAALTQNHRANPLRKMVEVERLGDHFHARLQKAVG